MTQECAVLPVEVIAGYVANSIGPAQAWSVEAHLPACRSCRAALAMHSDSARLDRNFAALMARSGLPRSGLIGRLLRRCGVPGHVVVLLESTPSLRRSWLAGVAGVLAIVVVASQLTAAAGGPRLSGQVLVPFMVIAPMVPLAAVAAAFSPVLDPAYRIASAAPVSKVWLLCIRATAVLVATLLPAAVAALALPSSQWMAVALLLPAIAICVTTLALASVIRAELAVVIAAAGWVALVLAVAEPAGEPVSVFGPGGQLIAAAVLVAAVAVIGLRRNKIEYGWME